MTPGIVHLGVGAFCRAHMAAHIDDILRTDPAWGIVGASLRRPETRQALAPQDFLYTLAVRSGSGTSTRVIGSVLDVLGAATQRDELIAAMADPRIRIVSLTVTEKGYCHDPATGALDPRHPDILHDLAHPTTGGNDVTRKTKDRGTDNVLAYLGFPDAEELTAKTILAKKINDILDRRGLTQVGAAKLLGMPQPKISAIRNYKLRGIALERLMQALTALGQHVEIIVSPSHSRVPARIDVAA